MSDYIMHNGKKTAVINIVVDPQKGFHDLALAHQQGGVLYVPNGEEVVAPIGKLVANTKNGIFIISNDWHPHDHLPDMSNHPGIMEYRKQELIKAGHTADDVYNPLKMGFSELVQDKDGMVIGLLEADKRIRRVELKTSDGQPPSAEDRGRVVKVLDDYLPQKLNEIVGASTQTLWTPHCIQGTESAQMHEGLNLPEGLSKKLASDLVKPVIHHKDSATGNEFFVVRKGTRSEVDSNGLLVENDRTTLTPAMGVFQDLAKKFRADGVDHVVINFMGLATNFCVEYSANQVAAIGAGFFDVAQMSKQMNLVPEACRGIPIPGGKDDPFSLAGTSPRLAEKYGFKETTIDEIIAMQKQKPTLQTTGALQADGGAEKERAVG